MSSSWHEEYEERFGSSDTKWTLHGTFIGIVQAAFARRNVQPAEISEVWLRIQQDHEKGKTKFTCYGKLCGYIHRISSNIAIDIQRKRSVEAKLDLRKLQHEQQELDPTKLSVLTSDRILALCGIIDVKLNEVELPKAMERLRLKLKSFGETPAKESPGDETLTLSLGLTPERIEMRVRMLHWYGSENTLLVYFLHLQGYQGVQIARILGLLPPKVSILLKRAKALFEKAKETLLEQHGDMLV